MNRADLFIQPVCAICGYHEAMPMSPLCVLCAEHAGQLGNAPRGSR